MNTKICTKCNKELPLSEFYSRGNGKLRSECKSCHSEFVNKKYFDRKNKINQIKESHRCAKCGETR